MILLVRKLDFQLSRKVHGTNSTVPTAAHEIHHDIKNNQNYSTNGNRNSYGRLYKHHGFRYTLQFAQKT
jgi:hypothetical protein